MLTLATASFAGTDAQHPDHPAVIMASTGEQLTYGELETRSNQVGQLVRSFSLRRGDVVAILLENHPRFLEIAWGAQRSGLYYTSINWHLAAEEIAYIVGDCGARVLFTSNAMRTTLAELQGQLPGVDHTLCVDGEPPGTTGYERAIAAQPGEAVADPAEGCELLYSSGTTGRPKAIKRALPPAGETLINHRGAAQVYRERYGAGADSVYLNPAPLYHSAPISSCMTIHRLGGTVVVMERFDAEQSLALIERHRVTLSQFVPTMFVRMLKLDPDVRARYDLSSLRCAIHASAPCPVEVKRHMIEWWGPILHEYYGGTESMGTTAITSPEWLEHPGSVGRPEGFRLHILDESGAELPTGEPGVVYFESDRQFEYLNDADKTASIQDSHGWRSLGDIGFLDDDGYLFLTDRATFMIISGGVNIYPQEIEDCFIGHPWVHDVAVFGVPNEEFGEEVKAVVQPAPEAPNEDECRDGLLAYSAQHLAKYKWPRSIDFVRELPRDPNGKLYKRQLRDRHWVRRPSHIF